MGRVWSTCASRPRRWTGSAVAVQALRRRVDPQWLHGVLGIVMVDSAGPGLSTTLGSTARGSEDCEDRFSTEKMLVSNGLAHRVKVERLSGDQQADWFALVVVVVTMSIIIIGITLVLPSYPTPRARIPCTPSEDIPLPAESIPTILRTSADIAGPSEPRGTGGHPNRSSVSSEQQSTSLICLHH